MNPVKQLALVELVIDKTQTRVQIDEDTVSDYAELMKSHVDLPPIVVFFDGSSHFVADGFHRFHAAKRRKAETISCDIREGTERDALEFALGANAEHGLRRSNDDKRRVVKIALEDDEWGRLRPRRIRRPQSPRTFLIGSQSTAYQR
jgi:ParB-like chromosome segregation protein Spo0J